jgi:hypothetical protein
MTSCIVVGCPKKFGIVGKGRRKVALFHLPTDPIVLKKWCDILSLNINDLSVTKSERVCSEHFSISDIIYLEEKRLLAKDALPIHTSKAGTCNFVKDFCKLISLFYAHR